jgi:hypothetical protein
LSQNSGAPDSELVIERSHDASSDVTTGPNAIWRLVFGSFY